MDYQRSLKRKSSGAKTLRADGGTRWKVERTGRKDGSGGGFFTASSNKRKVECCLGADAGILGWTEEKEQVIDGKRGPISRGKLSYWGSKSGGGEGKETKACPQPV